MYAASADPYCYPDTSVLRNIPGLRLQRDLDGFEAVSTAQRFMESMPRGRWSVRHYAAVHRHIFQDVYAWSGRFRTVRISKGGNMFCYPENIADAMRRAFADLRSTGSLRDRDPAAFAKGAAHFLAELNAIHPFRDGNGRAQLVFLALLGQQAGHPFDFEPLEPVSFLAAMIESFHGNEEPLAAHLARLNRSARDAI